MKKLSNYIIEEGAWGYDPQDNDSVLDLRGDLHLKMLELIYDECHKRVWGGVVDPDDPITIDGNSKWDVIGTIEFFFERCPYLSDVCINDDNKDSYDRYYYWWKLKKDKQKDIVELYSDAIFQLSGDKKFIEDWKEPEKMRQSLVVRGEKLKKYASLRDAYFKKQLDNENERILDTVNSVENIDSSCDKDEVVTPVEEYPNVTTLGDGEYDGALWGHCFVYEGKKYYSECGWKNIFPSYCKMVIENGKAWAHQVDEYQRESLKKLFQ